VHAVIAFTLIATAASLHNHHYHYHDVWLLPLNVFATITTRLLHGLVNHERMHLLLNQRCASVEALVEGVVCGSQDVTVVDISKQDNATWTPFQIFS